MAETTPLNPAAQLLGDLDDTAIRHGFVQKVYGILCSQLLASVVIGGAVMKYASVVPKGSPLLMALMIGSIVVTIAAMCIFMCASHLLRKSPENYIILGVFTIAESVLVGVISAQYTQESVLIVLGVTTLVVMGLTLFACQTSYDFTGFGPYLLCAMLVLLGMSFVLMLGSMLGLGGSPAFQALHLVYAGCGALLFSFYIVYDTQLIIGGKHAQCQFTIDDYVPAAINLYLDIINLFLYLLQLFGERK